MTPFHLSIVTPNGKVFEGEAESVIAPGTEGFFEVQGQHAPMVATLKHSALTVRQNGKSVYYVIGIGVLEVNPKHEVLILVDSAVSAEDLSQAYQKMKNDNYASIFATR